MTAPLPPLPWTEPNTFQGIDLSAVQKPNARRMQLAAAAGCIVVDIKACDYDTARRQPFQDPALLGHLQFAREAGLRTGTYAFFKSLHPWQAQAEQYLRTMDATGPLTLRPTLDWEDVDRIRIDPRRALDGALSWMAFVRTRAACRPSMYTAENVIAVLAQAQLDLAELRTYDLWQAHYRWDPVTGKDYGLPAPRPLLLNGILWPCKAWQCGGNGCPHLRTPPDAKGRVEVLDEDLDRDVYPNMPTIGAFDAWCADVAFLPPPKHVPVLDLTRPRDLQVALALLGYHPGAADGVIGPRTVAAVRQFQQRHGLTVDGIVGPKTRAAIALDLTGL